MKKVLLILFIFLGISLFANEKSVVDAHNNLEWQDNEEHIELKWKLAMGYCSQKRLSGFQDWRLPTKEELLLLSKEKGYKKNFQYMSDDVYWSSDDAPKDDLNAVTAYSGNGFVSTTDKCEKYAVICVKYLR